MELDRAAALTLARACAAGDAAARRRFEAALFSEVRACHARIRPVGLSVDELEHRVRDALFVDNAIARFPRKDNLRRWLRALTTRLINDHTRTHPDLPLEDQLLPALARRAPGRAELRTHIRAALRDAFAGLTEHQRQLLRSEVRGVALAVLAARHKVRVRTTQRWLHDAHEAFLVGFRHALAGRLRVAPDTLSSTLALARSQLLSGLGDVVRRA